MKETRVSTLDTRKGGIWDWRDSGLKGYKKGGFRAEGMRNMRNAKDIHERKDAHLVLKWRK